MLKIRTFILALIVTPLLAINWQLPSKSQTSPSLGTAGSMSGGGTTGSINTSPSLGTAGSISGGGTTITSGNTVSNPDPNTGGNRGQNNGENNRSNGNNQGTDNNPSSSVENLVPRASSITVFRTQDGKNTLRIAIKAQEDVNTAAANLLNANNSNSTLVAMAQGGSIGQTASNTLTQFLSGAGVNPEIGGSFATILRSIIVQSGNNQANVDINQLNNAINTYNRIVRESSPVTLQTLSQNQDFVAFGSALGELREAVQ
jgi:hypothetical protein